MYRSTTSSNPAPPSRTPSRDVSDIIANLKDVVKGMDKNLNVEPFDPPVSRVAYTISLVTNTLLYLL